MKKSFLTKSAKETKKIAEKLAQEAAKNKIKRKNAFVIGLRGDLGGGKTTFTQGFARGLAIKEKILSPTFVILKKFQIVNAKYINFCHIDCYRLKNHKEILDLGFEEIISNPQNIVLIEWPEKIKEVLPKNIIFIDFELAGENKRNITFNLGEL